MYLIEQSGGAPRRKRRNSRKRSKRRSTQRRRKSSSRRRTRKRRKSSPKRRKSTRRRKSNKRSGAGYYTLVNERGIPIVSTKYRAPSYESALEKITKALVGTSLIPRYSTKKTIYIRRIAKTPAASKVRKYIINPSGIYKYYSSPDYEYDSDDYDSFLGVRNWTEPRTNLVVLGNNWGSGRAAQQSALTQTSPQAQRTITPRPYNPVAHSSGVGTGMGSGMASSLKKSTHGFCYDKPNHPLCQGQKKIINRKEPSEMIKNIGDSLKFPPTRKYAKPYYG